MTKDKAIAELIRIWHSPHLDLSLKAGLAEAIDALKGEDGDLISRQDAIDGLNEVIRDHNITDFDAIATILDLPSAQPKIYGNEHNCVLTMFGECSYDRNGCGSCEVVDKIREAINAEPKTGKWDDIGGVIRWGCPFCHHAYESRSNFCPNCGTRMLGEDGEV